MKIEITDAPFTLAELEALCAVARRQGFPDNAGVKHTGNYVTITTDPEQIAEAQS